MSGKVVDEHGSVVRGVNVLIKGSPNGTVSDWDGQYNIQVPPGKSTLSFVLIGYKMLEKDLSIEGIVNYRLDVVLIKNKRKNRGKESSGELTQLTNP
ncbi:MAG: carboxypeptidase-like regulatory domain-containing protein [Bacteroidota bacterium]